MSEITLGTVEEALDALRAGKPVLVADSPDRENEADVIIAAQHATAEWVAWTIRHSSGYLCAPMPAARADAPLRGVELEGAAVRDPDEPRDVVEERQVELRALVVRPGRRAQPLVPQPRRGAARGVLLEEPLAADALGEPDAGDRAALELAQQRRRGAHHVVHRRGLRRAGARVQHAVQVREPDVAVADADGLRRVGRGHRASQASGPTSVRRPRMTGCRNRPEGVRVR